MYELIVGMRLQLIHTSEGEGYIPRTPFATLSQPRQKPNSHIKDGILKRGK